MLNYMRRMYQNILGFTNPILKHAIPVVLPITTRTYEEALVLLQGKYPVAFSMWQLVSKSAKTTYLSDPKNNLSVEGNLVAKYFSNFVRLFIRGPVLDIGCGIADFPIYLKGYPLRSIAGMDPEEPRNEHPFLFVRGVAEYIPWPNRSFETVIIATSLDHVISLDDTLSEIKRVLTTHGKLLIWVGFIEGAKPYDPYASDLINVDQYHLFHFDEPWFETLMEKHFVCIKKTKIDNSGFYCYEVKNEISRY